MANQLPSFVELMASLGLQDEHAANALLSGASDEQGQSGGAPASSTTSAATSISGQTSAAATASLNANNPAPAAAAAAVQHNRESVASLESTNTPLSTASLSLVTPLSSPSVQREHQRHGKKRYSPYGLMPLADGKDLYSTRRGSVPDVQAHERRMQHHLSAPDSHSYRLTDDDGDEEMEDAASLSPVQNYPSAASSTSSLSRPLSQQQQQQQQQQHSPKQPRSPYSPLHCAGQPNLLISRQRMIARPTTYAPNLPRTKSQSHIRTTSTGASSHSRSSYGPRPPLPDGASRVDMSLASPTTERSRDAGDDIIQQQQRVDAEGDDIAVVSISSLLRRSHPSNPSTQHGQHLRVPGESPAISLESPRAHQSLPPAPSIPPPIPPSSSSTNITLRAPPSAPPTKTTFGFLPGAPISGNISALSSARRARHARSSSARSVRDMIREREPNVLLAPLAPLHSFHPMGETDEEERENTDPRSSRQKRESGPYGAAAAVAVSRVRHKSLGKDSVAVDEDKVSLNSLPLPSTTTNSASSSSSFLPLVDDGSRSFSQRRRTKRHSNNSNTEGKTKRSSPPPPLMLPTLPLSFNIRSLVVNREEAHGNAGNADGGYVSRREPHSPAPADPGRGSWGRRRVSPQIAGM